MIPPGSTIGILGGGQLGRMTALAARRMGYRCLIFDPAADGPASHVADGQITAAYDDLQALERFAGEVDVVTFEFENVLPAAAEALSKHAPVRPSGEVLAISRNREREKSFLSKNGFPVGGFRIAASLDELKTAVAELGTPCVAKTIEGGYDGKGQIKIESAADVEKAWAGLGSQRIIVEAWVQFDLELSVIAARSPSGDHAVFAPAENIHRHHILDVSILPGRFPDSVAKQAVDLGNEIADALKIEGLVAIEMFLARDGRLLVNELAPRPHNSGHASFDACATSQFEQHFRAVCDLPLGNPEVLRPAVMVNLLGDLWPPHGGEPDWTPILRDRNAKLHLYGKTEARPGRKMGHFTVLGSTQQEAIERAQQLRTALGLPAFP